MADDLAILPAFQPIRTGSDFHGAAGREGIEGVAIVINPHKAGLCDGCWNSVEPVNRADTSDQAVAFFLDHLSDRLVAQVRVLVCPGVDDTAILQPCVQLNMGSELCTWRKDPAADRADLVLNLTLLPA